MTDDNSFIELSGFWELVYNYECLTFIHLGVIFFVCVHVEI